MVKSSNPVGGIVTVERLLDSTGFKGRIKIAFDEWNLRGWHSPGANKKTGFGAAEIKARDRNDLNGTYTMADALFSACFLNSCLRHADTVKMATIAPVVNTRGPLYVHPKGIVKRTTFHVMSMYSNLLGPQVAKAAVTSDRFGGVAALDVVATCDAAGKDWRIVLVNRHATATLNCTIKLGDKLVTGEYQATILSGDSPDAFNDVDKPNRVVPQTAKLRFTDGVAQLPPHSLVVLEIPEK
jgi:alpha-N-arabinofuranosidase